MNDIAPSLRKQLADAKENLHLIQERQSEFVLSEDIPLQLTKNERQRKAEIAKLEVRLESLKKGECPYRGLKAFEAKHAAFYYGRDDMVTNLVEQINRSSFVAVIGASGSGKSSLVRAGLIHTLQQSGEAWTISLLTLGRNPLDALSTRLVNWLYPQATEVNRLIEASQLARSLNDGTLPIQNVLARVRELHSGSQLLLLVDQFEELFTQDVGKAASERFISLVLEAAELDKGVRVVIAIRADFYAHLLSHPQLGEAIGDGQFNVLPLNDEELRAAIKQPALDMGREFEPGLVERIVDDVAGEPGNLPLLQFALQQLWARQNEKGWLTHDAYDKIGGVEQALARYAEDIYRSSKDDQTRMQRVLIQLVRPGEGTTDTRRLARRDELGEENWKMVIFLADKRLIVTHGERVIQANTLGTEYIQAQTIQTAEVAHEALIQGWSRLRQWMDQDRDFRIWQERLRVALRQWEDNKQDEGALYRGLTLSQALEWAKTHHDQLTEKEQLFIERSKALVEQEKAEREAQLQRELEQEQALREEAERRQKITTRLGTIVFIVALLAIFFAFLANRSAQRNADLAATNETVAQENVAIASTALAASTKVVEERNEAERQANMLLISQLASQSDETLNEFPQRSLLLAIESLHLTQNTNKVHGFVANQAIRNGLTDIKGIALSGYEGQINSVGISLDEEWLVAGNFDGITYRWNLKKLLSDPLILHGDEKPINAVTVSPDRQWRVTDNFDGTIRLWDLENLSANPLLLRVSEDPISAVTISTDGHWLVTGNYDGTVRLWDLTEPSADPLILHGHRGQIHRVVISSNKQWLVTCGDDRTARLWNLEDLSAPPLILHDHNSPTNSVVISPDEQWLVTGGWDKTVYLWNLEDLLADPLILRGHEGPIWSVAISPNGQWLVTGSEDETVRLWNLEVTDPSAEPLILRAHKGIVWGVTISPDGQWLVTTASGDKTALLWNLENPLANPLTLSGHENSIRITTFSSDGQLLFTASLDGIARLWNLPMASSVSPLILRPNEGIISDIAISPDDQWLVAGSLDGRANLWELEEPSTGPFILRSHEEPIYISAISPNGYWQMTDSRDNTARLWDISKPFLHGHEARINTVAISPDGQWLATGSLDKTVRLWNLSQPEAPPLILRGHKYTITEVAISANGQWLVTGGLDRTVRLWNLSQPEASPIILRGHEGPITEVVISLDGQWLVTGSRDNTARLWDLSQPKAPPLILRGHEGPVTEVAISPDAQWLVTSSRNNAARLWNLSQPKASPLILRGHEDAILEVTISPNGQWLVTGSRDNTARLWDLSQPKTSPLILRGHEGPIYTIAISANGEWLVTGSDDGTARLWDISEPEAPPLILRGHEGTIIEVAISHDGQWLVTADTDNTVRQWTLSNLRLINLACRRAGRNFTQTEWNQYFRGQPYRKSCEDLPIHYTVIQSLLEEARMLAREGNIDAAITMFKEVLDLDSTLDVEPESEAKRAAVEGLVEKGSRLARENDIDGAIAQFEEAQALDPEVEINAQDWNELCWQGSLWGYATDVMVACERAVELEPDHGGIIDSRGLARALNGDYEGAIEDFEVYVEWSKENDEYEEYGTQREEWIVELKAGRNPLDAETLEGLRNE